MLKGRYTLFQAENADEAIRMLAAKALAGVANSGIRVVLVDITMPGTDGITLCRRIKKEFYARVIMLTARAAPVDVQAAIQNGADDYLTKPFGTMTLVDKIAQQLKKSPRKYIRRHLTYGGMRSCVPSRYWWLTIRHSCV